MQRTENGSRKIVESVSVEGEQGELISLDQKVTYIEPDGDTHEYTAIGEGDYIEIMMPDSQKIDVEYAKDSIEGYRFKKVVVGVSSEDGVLVIPEDTVPLIAEYGYWVTVSGKDMKVTVDDKVVENMSDQPGEVVLSINRATDDDMTDSQRIVIGDRLAISVTLTVNGQYVSSLGGLADISVLTNDPNATVYYVDEQGNMELLESSFSGNGNTDFSVGHFSIYLIEMEEESSFPILWIVAIICVLALVIVLIAVARKRWKA
jgi:hypothetical protein